MISHSFESLTIKQITIEAFSIIPIFFFQLFGLLYHILSFLSIFFFSIIRFFSSQFFLIQFQYCQIFPILSILSTYFVQFCPIFKMFRLFSGCNKSQIVCAAGPILFYLEVKKGELSQAGDTTLEHEVACIDITPITENDNRSEIVSVGLWTDITVRLLKLPNLEEITKESLGGDIIPRSILMAQFEGTNYLLCAMGDGSLFYFTINSQGCLTEKKKVTLGKY